MKKILFVATVAEHFRFFYLPYFEYFKRKGWQVDCACSSFEKIPGCDHCHVIPIARSPQNPKNFLALKQVAGLIQNGGYDIIHCNTPVGGVITRIAAIKQRKLGTKVVYTAHGFHFFNGAPLLNWLVYFPVEKCLSRVTDCLVTINQEDYQAAKKHFKARNIVHVHGVGYNAEKFFKPLPDKKSKLRKKFGYAQDEILLVYVAEMNENKNQKLLIQAFQLIARQQVKARLLLVGPDRANGKNQDMVNSLGLAGTVRFFGARDDVCEILPMCDLAVASSLREGLPVNIMESLACGLPVVATDNRGHRELVKNGENGYLVKLGDYAGFARKVVEIIGDKGLYEQLSANASAGVSLYCSGCVLEEMKAVYGGL